MHLNVKNIQSHFINETVENRHIQRCKIRTYMLMQKKYIVGWESTPQIKQNARTHRDLCVYMSVCMCV